MQGGEFKNELEEMKSELWWRKLAGWVGIWSRTAKTDIVSITAIKIIVGTTAKDAVISFFTLNLVGAGCAKDQVIGIGAITSTPITVNNVGDGNRTALTGQQVP